MPNGGPGGRGRQKIWDRLENLRARDDRAFFLLRFSPGITVRIREWQLSQGYLGSSRMYVCTYTVDTRAISRGEAFSVCFGHAIVIRRSLLYLHIVRENPRQGIAIIVDVLEAGEILGVLLTSPESLECQQSLVPRRSLKREILARFDYTLTTHFQLDERYLRPGCVEI